jgi:hypothetical protein
MEIQTSSQPAPSLVVSQMLPLRAATVRKPDTPLELSTADLAFRVFAAFRAHPHISNVLTHISRANWNHVESALNAILDPVTTSEALSPLAHNILDLMCADRGVTGRILRPYFHAVLHRLVGPTGAERLIHHAEALFADIEKKAEQSARTNAPRVALTGDPACPRPTSTNA